MRHKELYPSEECNGRLLESTKYVDKDGAPITVCGECGMVIEKVADEA